MAVEYSNLTVVCQLDAARDMLYPCCFQSAHMQSWHPCYSLVPGLEPWLKEFLREIVFRPYVLPDKFIWPIVQVTSCHPVSLHGITKNQIAMHVQAPAVLIVVSMKRVPFVLAM